MEKIDIFERLKSGEEIPMNDPDYEDIRLEVNRTMGILNKMNKADNVDEVRKYLGEVIGKPVHETTTLFIPFHTNIGKNICLGENVFINHACSFLDLGGIEIKDNVMIGPRVNITSENHPINPKTRKTMVPAKIVLEENVWIGAGATILPGVTIGRNSVVAAGAVVNKDVPANTVVAGVPAKVIKQLN